MPLALDPTETFDVSLSTDTAKPEADRPVFIFRYMTGRQRRQVDKLFAERVDIETLPAEQMRAEQERITTELYRAVEGMLVGWRNLPAPFDPAELDALVTDGECWELFFAMQRQGRLVAEDKKKLESPSPIPSDESAPAAAGDANGA